MSKEQATTEINAMWFRVVEEGDRAGHEGFMFTYASGTWIAD